MTKLSLQRKQDPADSAAFPILLHAQHAHAQGAARRAHDRHLEDEYVVELRVGPRAPGLGLAWPPVVREDPELHQCRVAVEAGREVAKAEQGHHELLGAVPVLNREAEAGGRARRWRRRPIQRGVRVQTGQQRPHRVAP